ncbi:MAG: RCC1 domain-containing protein [Clostridiales bacterium]|nr:RCC1 domain-containing protein [Clostridiales bacterium]
MSLTSPPKPAKPPKPVKAAEENKKAEKPALPKKRLLIIAAALLAVLALCLTVPKAINTAGENNVEDVQDTHLDELAAAREAIADHRETTIGAGALYTIGLKSDGTVVAVGDNAYGQNDVSSWTDIALPE